MSEDQKEKKSHPMQDEVSNTHMLTCREFGKLFKLKPDKLNLIFKKYTDFLPANSNTRIPQAIVRTILKSFGLNYEKRILSFINLKGGVGKTTIAITSATRAVQLGYKVVIIDLDPQSSASLVYKKEACESDMIFLDIWKKPEELAISSLKYINPNLAILPSSLENSLLDSSLSNPGNQKMAVKGVCDTLLSAGFDLVMIDCPPSLGTAVVSSICASNLVVIPINNDPFSSKGLELTIQEVNAICDAFGISTPGLRILYNRYDRRERMTDETWQIIEQSYPEFLHPDPIPTSSLFSRALNESKTLFDLPANHPAKKVYDSFVFSLSGHKFTDISEGARNAAK